MLDKSTDEFVSIIAARVKAAGINQEILFTLLEDKAAAKAFGDKIIDVIFDPEKVSVSKEFRQAAKIFYQNFEEGIYDCTIGKQVTGTVVGIGSLGAAGIILTKLLVGDVANAPWLVAGLMASSLVPSGTLLALTQRHRSKFAHANGNALRAGFQNAVEEIFSDPRNLAAALKGRRGEWTFEEHMKSAILNGNPTEAAFVTGISRMTQLNTTYEWGMNPIVESHMKKTAAACPVRNLWDIIWSNGQEMALNPA